jgi:H+-transporting ATPase
MADSGGHSSNNSSDAPNHLNTNIESGHFDEKLPHDTDPSARKPMMEDEEDEDMDALIDELESQDGHLEEEEGDAGAVPGAERVVPEDQLQTDTRVGLTESEVHARRKKYGMNQMKEEKENLILKFLGYFVGPIQFVMEVCYLIFSLFLLLLLLPLTLPLLSSSLPVPDPPFLAIIPATPEPTANIFFGLIGCRCPCCWS